MTTTEANTRQLRCIRKLAKAWRIKVESAAVLWCEKCAKRWREGNGDDTTIQSSINLHSTRSGYRRNDWGDGMSDNGNVRATSSAGLKLQTMARVKRVSPEHCVMGSPWFLLAIGLGAGFWVAVWWVTA